VTAYAYPSSFPTSEQLLFLKTIMAPKGGFASLWKQLKGQIDLDTLDTSTYRLLPSLYLRMAQEEDFHDEWLGRIKGVYRQGWARNQLLLNATASVVEALNHQGIPSILLKGVSLLLSSYRDVGGRMMGDADLLVPLEKAVDACNLMLSLGWKTRLGADIKWFDDKNILLYVRTTHEKSFVNAQGQILDLHFISPFHNVYAPDQVRGFWQTAVPIMVNGTPCQVLSPEMLFLHVCYHGYRKNRMASYRWVLDALRTVQSSPNFDWAQLIGFSKLLGFTFHLKMAVSYLVEHFHFSISEPERNALGNYRPNQQELRDYYGSMNISLLNMGNLPILWGKFKLEYPTEPMIYRPFRFSKYLKETYILGHRGELVTMYFKRFINRLKA
jgi:Uncharacterised nucleotidyltransferase